MCGYGIIGEGLDLKMGGGGSPFQSNFGAAKDALQNFELKNGCLKVACSRCN